MSRRVPCPLATTSWVPCHIVEYLANPTDGDIIRVKGMGYMTRKMARELEKFKITPAEWAEKNAPQNKKGP